MAKDDALSARQRLKQIGAYATSIARAGRADLVGGLLMACGRAAVLVPNGKKLSVRIWRMVKAWNGEWGIRTVVGALESGMWIGALGRIQQKEMGLVMRAVLEGMNRGQKWQQVAVTVLERGDWEEMFTMIEVYGGWEGMLEGIETAAGSGTIESVHVALLGTLIGRRGQVGERARKGFVACLRAKQDVFGGNGEGNSCGNKWAVLVRAVRMIGKVDEGDSVLSVLEGVVWEGEELGKELLYEAFIWIGEWRKRIVKGIAAGLTGGGRGFCDLLEHICAWTGVREVGEEIVTLLDFVGGLGWASAGRVVRAVVSASMGVPSLRERVWRFLRKNAGTRVSKTQYVVCSGLFAILRYEGREEEVGEMLGRMFDRADVDVRRYFVKMTMKLISECTERIERIWEVVDLSLKPLREIEMGKNGRASAFDFSRTFEKTRGGWLIRDDLPLLLIFCSRMLGSSIGTDSLFSRLIEYIESVEGALYHNCIPDVDKAPVYMRIKQLCSVFEAMSCIDVARLSADRVSLYALALLMRENMALAKSSSSVPAMRDIDVAKVAHQHSELNPLALLTIEEAHVSKETAGCSGEVGEVLLPLRNYLKALQAVVEMDLEILLSELVQAELLNIIATRLENEFRRQQTIVSFVNVSKLLDLSKQCFVKSCPWVVSKNEEREDTVTATSRLRQDDLRSCELQSHSSQLSSGQFRQLCDRMVQEVLFEEDVKKAFRPQQLEKVSESTPLIIRQVALRVLLLILAHKVIDIKWFYVFLFIEDVSVAKQTRTRGTNQEQEETENSDRDCKLRTVNAISQVLRLEFEHSLSIALTLSYLDILAMILGFIREDDGDGDTVRKVILSTVTGLLREYSIRHLRVLRSMVNIVLNAFGIEKALEFSAGVVKWLGNESCLLNSTYASKEGAYIGVQDFDVDILEEALCYDLECEQDRRTETSSQVQEPNGYIEETPPQENYNLGQEGDPQTKLEIGVRDGQGNTDSVKSLCLNETAESALLSIDCILNYCTTHLRATLDRNRRSGKEGFVADSGDARTISGVVNVLQELFHTQFGEFRSSRASRAPPSMGRKVGLLIQSLCEIADLQLKLAMKQLCNSSRECELKGLATTSKVILDLIFDNPTMARVHASMQDSDCSMRMTFLQERLDSTVTAFLLCVANRPLSYLADFCGVLQRHVSEIGNREEHDEGDPEFSQVLVKRRQRPSKRQRIRSRNRNVDYWLRDESGDDDYADLEDFVVPLEETDL